MRGIRLRGTRSPEKRTKPGEAPLIRGSGMILLGQVNHNGFGLHIAQPDEIGGRETRRVCVILKDVKAHYPQAP